MSDEQRRPIEGTGTVNEPLDLNDLVSYEPEASPPLVVTNADVELALRQQTEELLQRLDSGSEPLNITCRSCGGPSPLEAVNCVYCGNGLADEKATLVQELRRRGRDDTLVIRPEDLGSESGTITITPEDIEAANRPTVVITREDLGEQSPPPVRQEQLDQAFKQLDHVAQIGAAEIDSENQRLLTRWMSGMSSSERDLLVQMLENPDLVATCVRVGFEGKEGLRQLITADDLSQFERQRYDAIIGGGVSELVRTVQNVNRIVNWSTFHKLYDAVQGNRPWLKKVNSVRWILGI